MILTLTTMVTGCARATTPSPAPFSPQATPQQMTATTPLSRPSPAASPTMSTAVPTPLASPTGPNTVSTPSALTSEPGCVVERPASWDEALERRSLALPEELIQDAPGHHFQLFTLSPDGKRWFGVLSATEWSGIVTGLVGDQSYQRVYQISNAPVEQVTPLAADERWLAFIWAPNAWWVEWRLFAWDSQTGETFEITRSHPDEGFLGWQIWPALSHGLLAWVQGELAPPATPEAPPRMHSELHVYDLARRTDRILSTNLPTYPVVFWWPYLIWSELQAPGQRGQLVMADAQTGAPVPLPAPLAAHQRHVVWLAASPDFLAWSDSRTLWVWRPGQPEAQALFQKRGKTDDDAIQFLTIAGPLVSWQPPARPPMVADTRSGSVAEMPGHSAGFGDLLLVLIPSRWGPPEMDPVFERPFAPPDLARLVPVAALPPLPACDGGK